MSDNTCKHCGVGINFIRLRTDDPNRPDTFDWCHSLGGRRCNQYDYTFAEPGAGE